MYRRRYYWLYGALSVPGRLYVCTRYLSGGTSHLCMISRFSIPLESYKENSALWTLSAKRKEQLPCYYGPVTNVSRM